MSLVSDEGMCSHFRVCSSINAYMYVHTSNSIKFIMQFFYVHVLQLTLGGTIHACTNSDFSVV